MTKRIREELKNTLVESMEKYKDSKRVGANLTMFMVDGLEKLFRSWVLGIVKEMRNKEFPIGEREWCKDCGEKIADYLLEE